jgi:hypothetical protein
MGERFFFDRVDVGGSHVSPGDVELAVAVEAHLANAAPAGFDQQRWAQAWQRTAPSASTLKS